jgi:N utilization substance protein A
MKTEFTAAITQLSAERNLPKEAILAALEAALASAYKKGAPSPDQDILVKIDPDDGKIRAYIQKVVVDSVTNPYGEISVDEARNLRDMIQVGDVMELEFEPTNAGRITAQTTRQVVLQRLREAEHRTIYEEFTDREGEVVTGVVQFIDPKQIYVRLNRTEAILPLSEQMHDERYYRGQRLKLYLLEVVRSDRGPQIIVSRSHPSLLRRLFELEIPEVHSRVVELKAIAREAGHRSKVAVSAHQDGIEPVGCCLGPRGVRLQGIINELSGEKIDVIQWHSDPGVFISNALSPAQVASIKINEAEKVATVVVPDRQLSLAIGKEGQNARLAARLTGWRIDIKSVSAAEAERAASQELETVEETVEEEPIAPEPVTIEPVSEPVEPLAIFELEAPLEKPEEKTQIRFAEDILPTTPKIGRRGKEKEKKLEKEKEKGKRHKKQIVHLEDDAYEE